MAEKDGLTELARMIKQGEPKPSPSITTGIVISPPPDPQIQLNDVIVLGKENLIFAASIVNGYERHLKFIDTNCGSTSTVNDGGDNASDHSHGIEVINIDTLAQWTDTIKPGDEVILMPVVDGQMYYVLDKAVKFE